MYLRQCALIRDQRTGMFQTEGGREPRCKIPPITHWIKLFLGVLLSVIILSELVGLVYYWVGVLGDVMSVGTRLLHFGFDEWDEIVIVSECRGCLNREGLVAS